MAQPLTTLAQNLEDGDLFADAAGLRLAVGVDAVVVLVSNAIRQQPGEDRMQPTRGTDWPGLMGKGASPVAVRTAIARQVGGVSGVDRVVTCEVAAGTPTMPCTLTLETSEGPTSVVVGVG